MPPALPEDNYVILKKDVRVATSADYKISAAEFTGFDPCAMQTHGALHLNWVAIQIGNVYLD